MSKEVNKFITSLSVLMEPKILQKWKNIEIECVREVMSVIGYTTVLNLQIGKKHTVFFCGFEKSYKINY